MSFLKRLFDNKERCRDFMKAAYKKARGDAHAASIPGATPHEVGLYSALANFYRFRGMRVGEMELWPELLPFLLMPESDSIEALAEYAVFKQWGPAETVMSRVQPQLNSVLRNMNSLDQDRKITIMTALTLAKAYVDSGGRSGHPIAWFTMLDEEVRARLDFLALSFAS